MIALDDDAPDVSGLPVICYGLQGPIPCPAPKRRILGIDPGLHNFGIVLMEEDMFSNRLSLALGMATLATQVSRDSAKHFEVPTVVAEDDCSWYAAPVQPEQGEGRDRKATHNIPQDISPMFDRLLQRAKPSRLVKSIVPNNTFNKTTAEVIREGFAALEPQTRQLERELFIRDALRAAKKQLYLSEDVITAKLHDHFGTAFELVIGDTSLFGHGTAYDITVLKGETVLIVSTEVWNDVAKYGPVPGPREFLEIDRRLYHVVFGVPAFLPSADVSAVIETLSDQLRNYPEADALAGPFINAHFLTGLNTNPLFDFPTGEFLDGAVWQHASNVGKSCKTDFLARTIPVPEGRDENEWRAEVRYRIATGQTDMTKPMVMYDTEGTMNPGLLTVFETYTSEINPNKDAAE